MAGYILADARTPVRSPWSSTSLTRIALADLAGVLPGEVTRAKAMLVPAVVRARGLICGTLSRYPLTLWQPNPDDPTGDSDVRLPTPAWMTSTKTLQSPRLRMLWTLDDLLFSGLSLWAVERAGDGAITDSLRVPPPEWAVDPDSLGVKVRGTTASAEEVILFEGPQEGLITIAADAVQASLDMSRAWRARVKSPVPLVELHNTDPNDDLTDDEIRDLVDSWETARSEGGTAYTPATIQTNVHGAVVADLYVEGRNAERLDWGNYTNLPASLLDGSMSTATLTYSTSEGKRAEFVDYSLSYWASPVEARLSQDDVTPEGTYSRYDLSWLTNPKQSGLLPGQED